MNDNAGLNGNTIVLKNTFPVNGNEIDEIISKKPPFFVRWGTIFFLLLLITIAAITWFIQYPDIVRATATLTSINAPKEVMAKTSGALIKLFVKEGETVKPGTVIGYMESTAHPEEVIKLSDAIDSMAFLLINNTSLLIPHFNTTYKNLGELQQDYQAFTQAEINFRNYIADGFYLNKRKMLSKDLQLLEKLQANLLQQKSLNAEDLQLTQTTFSANESLKDEKVISDLDYRIEKSKLINKKLTLPQLNAALINNETQQHEKHKEIIELENTIAEQKNIFRQSLNTFKSRLNEWKKKYLLTAPVEGKIAYTSFIQEMQQLQQNQIICYTIPGNTQYYAELNIPQTSFGKVNKGQTVLLKTVAYPYQQFGILKCKLDFVGAIPSDSGYTAKALLPDGLITNYGKQLQYKEGLKASAEIITENLRLSDRILIQVKSVFTNNSF